MFKPQPVSEEPEVGILTWVDCQATGDNPRLDRILRFSTLDTDLDGNHVGKVETLFCKPPLDLLPNPVVLLHDGISPLACALKGLSESDLSEFVQHRFSQPHRLSGYGSVARDGEMLRFLAWRSLRRPYEPETWGRLDLSGVLRLAKLLYPFSFPGSLTLEALAKDLDTTRSLPYPSDPEFRLFAMTFLYRLVRSRHPELLKSLGIRDRSSTVKRFLRSYTNPKGVLLMPRYQFSERKDRLALIAPLVWSEAEHALLAADISLLSKTHAITAPLDPPTPFEEEVGTLFWLRPGRLPPLADIRYLTAHSMRSHDLGLSAVQSWLEKLWNPEYRSALRLALDKPRAQQPQDADTALYEHFLSPEDQRIADQVVSGKYLAGAEFQDAVLKEVWQRYGWRNMGQTSDFAWMEYCRSRLLNGVGSAPSFEKYFLMLRGLEGRYGASSVLNDLRSWGLALSDAVLGSEARQRWLLPVTA